ncbi:MAG: PDZ domain-containing protein, partial [Pseudomonadota bacterium]
ARITKEIVMKGRVTRVLSGLQLGRAVGRLGTGRMAARVVRVRANSPGALAGLKPGDAIYSAGGHRVRKPADFRNAMNRQAPPFKLPLKVMRGTRKLSPVLDIPATDWSIPRDGTAEN